MRLQKAILFFCVAASITACTSETSFKSIKGKNQTGNEVPSDDCETPHVYVTGDLFVEVNEPATLYYDIETDPRWVINGDDGEEIHVGSPITVTFTNVRTYRGQAWGTDECGRSQRHPFTVTVLPAMSTPRIEINAGDELTKSRNVQLSLNVENASEMYVTNDPTCTEGGTWEPYAESKNWVLKEESLDARVYAKFRSPAKSSACVSDSIIYDETAPLIQLVKVPESRSYISNADFEFSVTDNVVGVKSVSCSLDDLSFQECASPLSYEGLSYGKHNFRIYATDNVGNTSSITSYEWEYVNQNPTVTILTTPPPVSVDPTADFTFTGSDDSGRVSFECRLNNGEFEECSSPAFYDQLPNDNHTFYVRAKDPQGLLSEVASYTWKVDVKEVPVPVPPVVTITAHPESTTYDTKAVFEFEATHSGAGINAFYCTLDGALPVRCSSPTEFNVGIGSHTFTVYAMDNDELKSNTASYSWNVMKKRVPIIDTVTIDSKGKKLDIVIVDDNSPSMIEEQKKMGKRFSTFIDRLKGIDWQLSIITTDASSGSSAGKDGRLLPFKGLKDVYSINALTPNVHKVFQDTVVRSEWGSSTEEGIRSLYKMFNRPENRFVVRDHSHVASIIISDEDEKSTGTNLKKENQPDNLVSTFKGKFGQTNTYSNHSIILQKGFDAKTCKQVGSWAYGETYRKLSNLTNGVVGDLCAPDYGDILKNIGDTCNGKTFTAKLKCAPVGDVVVRLNPENSAIKHTVNGQELTLEPYPAIGTKVEIEYYCE